MQNFERFYVSQVGVLIRDNKCLILEFFEHPGEWGLPGGRIDKGEMWEEAFRREFKEEVNFDDFKIHDIIDYDIFYRKSKHPYCVIVRYIENNESEIVLSHEHSQFKWISEEELNNCNFIWENLPRMLKKGFEYHKELKNKS